MAKRVFGFFYLFLAASAFEIPESCSSLDSLKEGETNLKTLSETKGAPHYSLEGASSKITFILDNINGRRVLTAIRISKRQDEYKPAVVNNMELPGDMIEGDFLACQYDQENYYTQKVLILRKNICKTVTPVESPNMPKISIEKDEISGELDKLPDYFDKLPFLGQGGFGEVRKLTTSDGQELAIKRSTLDKIPLREVVITRAFSNSQYGSTYRGCIVAGNNIFLVTGLLVTSVESSEFRNLYKQKSIQQRLEFFIQITEAEIDFAKAGFVHNDIKVGNIMLDANGVPHLIDFGASAVIGGTETAVGTWMYRSPLRFQKKANSLASDIYSLACVYAVLERGFGDTSLIFDFNAMQSLTQEKYPMLPKDDPLNHYENVVISAFTERWGLYDPKQSDVSKMNLTTLVHKILVDLDESITLDMILTHLKKLLKIAKEGGNVKLISKILI